MNSATEAVKLGAEVMDNQWPGWWSKDYPSAINLDSLDVARNTLCPIGQVSGKYGAGMRILGQSFFGDFAVSHGFIALISCNHSPAELTEAWRDLIEERRDDPVPT